MVKGVEKLMSWNDVGISTSTRQVLSHWDQYIYFFLGQTASDLL